MFLSNQNQTLEISLSSNTVSNPININVNYADHTARIPVAGASSVLVTSTGPTVIVSGAATGYQRQIKNISIYNQDTLANEITIKQTFPNKITRVVETIQSNQTLQYVEHKGWSVV